jgi:hypothetical protein
LGCAGLLAAAAIAGRIGSEPSHGRDAVRLIGRTAVVVPAGPLLRGDSSWPVADVGWGPLYEPHRHPDGAEIGSRLLLPAGEYAIEIAAFRVPSSLPAPDLEVRGPAGPLRAPLVEQAGLLSGRFRQPAATQVTLVLTGGGPFILKEMRLRRSTFSGPGGPTP